MTGKAKKANEKLKKRMKEIGKKTAKKAKEWNRT